MKLSVMPQGVEHKNLGAALAGDSFVKLSVMPQGVEHERTDDGVLSPVDQRETIRDAARR